MRECCTYPPLLLPHHRRVFQQCRWNTWTQLCCNTTLKPVPNTILKPGKFDNTDHSQKKSLEVQSIVRNFANALHHNNHQGGNSTNSIGFNPAYRKTSVTTGTFLAFQGKNMVFLSVERYYREVWKLHVNWVSQFWKDYWFIIWFCRDIFQINLPVYNHMKIALVLQFKLLLLATKHQSCERTTTV